MKILQKIFCEKMKILLLILILNFKLISSTNITKNDVSNQKKPELPYYVIPNPSAQELGKYLTNIFVNSLLL